MSLRSPAGAKSQRLPTVDGNSDPNEAPPFSFQPSTRILPTFDRQEFGNNNLFGGLTTLTDCPSFIALNLSDNNRDIFCAGRVIEEDLQHVDAVIGGTIQTSVNNVIDEVLGSCEVFEERQVGNERFNIFNGCPFGQTTTIVLRGGADQFIEEAERSLHDAIIIVRRALKNSTIVPGDGTKPVFKGACPYNSWEVTAMYQFIC
ncbi:hypothetical protein ZIOFF_010710 [Zingiber officinale]|uniref:Uncharacterized protein n=1 Tax=Zingiber officinale TaxID=94328 RepID=A0A8J5I6M6_ZINOF|nr:hypothetical protein ZIOFF_010710 [Zingiber officinale]